MQAELKKLSIRVPSFIHSICIEHLLCVGPCSRHRGREVTRMAADLAGKDTGRH